MHIYMYSVRCCSVVNSVAKLRRIFLSTILAIAEALCLEREREREREKVRVRLVITCLQVYFANFKVATLQMNRNLLYLDDTVFIVMWKFMKNHVNNIIRYEKN